MNRQDAFERLKVNFKLKDSDFYFLELLPLIQMLWADGKNQAGELKILYKYVVEHIAYLDRKAGIKTITTQDANDFLDRFAHSRPSPQLLNELQEITSLTDTSQDIPRQKTILEYCLDIAAACTTGYPYKPQDRIMLEEKKLLTTLFKELHVSPDQKSNIWLL